MQGRTQGRTPIHEIEAEKAGWSVSVLERQIHSFLFARLLKSRDKAGVLALADEGQTVSQPMLCVSNNRNRCWV